MSKLSKKEYSELYTNIFYFKDDIKNRQVVAPLNMYQDITDEGVKRLQTDINIWALGLMSALARIEKIEDILNKLINKVK